MKVYILGVLIMVLWLKPRLLFADDLDWDFANQLTIEAQISGLGAAAFADVPQGWFQQITFGFGLYHPNEARPMFRNSLGIISWPIFDGRRIAETEEVEVVFIQPLSGIAANFLSYAFRPYIGWGYSLAVLKMDSRSRGYSAWVLETGVDFWQIGLTEIAGVRVSIRVLAGWEHIVVGVFLGTLLHPASVVEAACLK